MKLSQIQQNITATGNLAKGYARLSAFT